jgi:hypothetical protein
MSNGGDPALPVPSVPAPAAPVPAPASPPAQGALTEHRRFTLAGLTALIEGAGLRAGDAHGVRIFAGLLPGVGADPATADALRELEAAAAAYPALRDIAARLHIFGHR